MPRIETRRAHQLAYQQRFSRPVRWLGCAGLVVGLLMILAPSLAGSRPGKPSAKITAGGILLTVISAGLVWGRRGKRFDRETRTISFWWGAPWAVARTTYDLPAFQSLGVEPYEQRGRLRWRVALLASDGERLDLFDLPAAAPAHAAAEQIGQFLALPVQIAAEPSLSGTRPSDENHASTPDVQSPGE